MRLGFAASLVVLLFAAAPAHAQNDANSVNWMLPGCRAADQDRFNDDPMRSGLCMGVIDAIAFASPTVCASNNIALGQKIAVTLRYLEARPNRWHENFKMMTNEALTATWPCRR